MKLKYVNHVKEKVFSVIRSCNNHQQLVAAKTYMYLFFRLYKVSTDTDVAKRILSFYNLKRLKLRSKGKL